MLLVRAPKPGLVVASEGALTVALDTVVTEELRLEGLAREIVNRVQNLRKTADLDVSTRVRVTLRCGGALAAAAAAWGEMIRGETLAQAIASRHTNRRLAAPSPLADAHLEAMRDAANDPQGIFAIHTDRAVLGTLGGWLGDVDRLRFLDPRMHDELIAELVGQNAVTQVNTLAGFVARTSPRAVGKSKAMDMILTARMMDAAEAERAGLVSRVVPADKLIDEALGAAAVICSYGMPSVMMAKECVNRAFEGSLSDGVSYERRLFHAMFATEDQKEGMDAFLSKRAPVFKHR